MNDFLGGYIHAAAGHAPVDPDSRERMRRDCERFYAEASAAIKEAGYSDFAAGVEFWRARQDDMKRWPVDGRSGAKLLRATMRFAVVEVWEQGGALHANDSAW